MRDRAKQFLRLLFGLALALTLAVAGLIALYTVVTPYTPLMAFHALSGPMTRIPVRLDQVTPSVPALLIASEDSRFCTHHGVDWDAIRDAMDDEDGPSRGASTLAMQVARNLFLWQGAPTYPRKILEIPLALTLDTVWSKRRLLEVYLNIAEWGPSGEFGLEAGARKAFGKGANALSPREAALLVAVLPNPVRRLAGQPSAPVRRKAGLILARAPQADTACLHQKK